MDALEAIFTRRSVPKVKPDPLPREVIERLLSAAVQAPNHYRVRPWRFIVLTGDARARLGEVMARSLQSRHPDAGYSIIEAERAKPLRAPVLIAVGVDKPSEPKVVDMENICAAAAAVENILIAANALGLGAMWRTGTAATDPAVKQFLGFEKDQHLIAFVYIGYPAAVPEPRERPGYEDRVTWMDA